MPHAYTEDQLVEQPAIGLFAELGWQMVSALQEVFGAPSPGLSATLSHPTGEGASLGRETPGEAALAPAHRLSGNDGSNRTQKCSSPILGHAITRARSALERTFHSPGRNAPSS
jgi:hypothetical protein